jgi:hypothetical protein
MAAAPGSDSSATASRLVLVAGVLSVEHSVPVPSRSLLAFRVIGPAFGVPEMRP